MNNIHGRSRLENIGLAVLGLVMVGSTAGISWADDAKTSVTFAKDVAPIFQKNCQVCHRAGTNAPMSLVSYQEVRPWARAIRERVAARDMPPWHLDKTVGIQKFTNDRSLSDEQIATIVSWVDAGAPLGDPKDLPPPVEFADEDQWFIGKPDLIVMLPKEHVQPANGSDWWGNLVADSGLTEDRYIKAVQVRPSKEGRRISHHIILTLVNDSNTPMEGGSFLAEYAVGKYGEVYPEGTGKLMKAGSQISFGLHYFSAGEEIRDRTAVGLVFYPKGYVPKHRMEGIQFKAQNEDLDIPPGAVVSSDDYFRLPKAARITGYQPHMHMRGKSMCLEAILPDGAKQILNCVDRFNFNWHVMYLYDDDVAPLLPANTMLHIVGTHDNSSGYRRNPDASLWVGWGQRSIDEMTAAWINLIYLTDEELKVQTAEREKQSAN
jgi:hypothetical protein